MSRAKAAIVCMCLNGTPLGSVNRQSAQLPQVTELKYRGSTLQNDGDMNTEVIKRTPCGWNNRRRMIGVLRDTRMPPHVKGKIHSIIVQPAMLYGMKTVPMTSAHVKKLEVTEMKMCIWSCGGHKISDHVRNDHIRVRMKVGNITKRYRRASGLDNVTRPRFEAKDTSEERLWRYKIQFKIQDTRSFI